MLRLTMTDNFHYQDVFQKINIPETEYEIALEAKNLFDIANGVEPRDPLIHKHLKKVIDSEGASQVFWDFEHDKDDKHHYHRLVLTLQRQALRIAIENRDFNNPDADIRKTLAISNGESKVYSSGVSSHGRIDNGSTSELAIADFEESFALTTAGLSLYHHIHVLHQNESNEAILDNAA